MSFSGRKLKALIQKEFRDSFKNKNVMIVALLPIFFSILYTKLPIGLDEGMGKWFILLICSVLTVSALPCSFLSMIVAEEKEKNTLRTLMLSNVSSFEFLFSKAFVTLVYSEIINIIVFFIIGVDISSLASFLLVTTVALIPLLFFGAAIGLLAKDQMTTGLYSSPVMIVLMILPMFAMMKDSIRSVARFFPTNAMMELYFSMSKDPKIIKMLGDDFNDLFNWGVLAVWMIICLAVFWFVYKKKGLDN